MRCPHTSTSERLIVRAGSTANDTFCMLCGLNLTVGGTWEDLDEAGKELKEYVDSKRRSILVARAEQKERMSNTAPRTFHCTTGTSNKFWTVWRAERLHLVRYGPIGSDGQTRQKEHPSINLANVAISTLIRKKLSKGYVEIEDDDMTEEEIVDAIDAAVNPKRRDQSAAAKKAWVTRRANEAAAKKKAKSAEPPGFMRPRRLPKVER